MGRVIQSYVLQYTERLGSGFARVWLAFHCTACCGIEVCGLRAVGLKPFLTCAPFWESKNVRPLTVFVISKDTSCHGSIRTMIILSVLLKSVPTSALSSFCHPRPPPSGMNLWPSKSGTWYAVWERGKNAVTSSFLRKTEPYIRRGQGHCSPSDDFQCCHLADL